MRRSRPADLLAFFRRRLVVAVAAMALPGGVQAATLTWRGTTDGAWNTTTANWAGGAGTFAAGDIVTFDDTATGTTGITIAAAVSPSGTVTFNNTTKNYSLSGPGGLVGNLSLLKLGAGSLTLSGSNNYTGPNATVLRGGTTTFSGNAIVTSTNATANTFNIGTQAGDNATLVIKDNASVTSNGLQMANNATSRAAVLMQGGSFTILNNGAASNWFRIGASGTAVWNQSGGLTNIGSTLPTIGRNSGSDGQVTVSSGTFRLTGTTSSDYLQLAAQGNGTLTVSGNGVVETGTGSSGGLWFNVVSGSGQTTGTGTLNLDGGTLRTRRVLSSGSVAATSTFNFNGGTLVALTSNATYLQGLTAANVKAGGAVIDTNGNSITIAQSLLDSGSGGLRKVGGGTLTLSGSNTYRGGTVVESGTLGLGHASALGWSGGSLTLNAGATLDLNGYSPSAGRLSLTNAVLLGFDQVGTGQRLSVASALVSGTTYVEVTPPTSGTYDLITSSAGGLSGAFMFQGAQSLSVPATRMIAKSGTGFLDLQLVNSATAEKLVVRAADTAGLMSIMPLGASITAGFSVTGTAKNGGSSRRTTAAATARSSIRVS